MRHIKQYKIFESPKFTEEDISTMVDDMLYLINDILDDEFIEEWDDVGYPPLGNYTTADRDFWKRDVTSYKDSLISDGIRIYTKSISKSKRIIERIKSEQDQIESYIGTSISINRSESSIKGDNEKFIIISVGIKWKNFSDRVNDVKKFLSFVAEIPKRMNESKLDDSMHKKKAINNINGHIGLINNWGWKGSYIFVDLEDGTTTEMKDLNDVKIINDDEFYNLYNDRNYQVPKKDEIFTDRQKTYGKIHDFALNARQNMYSNSEYSDDFCREVAQIISTTAFYRAILKEYGTVDIEKVKEKDPSGLKEIFYSYQMGEDSCYSNMCDKMGLHGDSVMSESEILSYLEDAREFSEEHGIEWMPKEMSPELEFFIKLI